MSDGELAGLIGVRRQTVNNWINALRDGFSSVGGRINRRNFK